MKTGLKFGVVAALGALFAATSALAADDIQDGMRLVVSYGDLDVTHANGAHILLERLHAAASAVCGGTPEIRDLARQAFYRSCTQEALTRAVAHIDVPLVSSLYHAPQEQIASNR